MFGYRVPAPDEAMLISGRGGGAQGSPFKVVIGGAYKAVERRLLDAIHVRFGLPPELPAEIVAIIKAADRGDMPIERGL